MNAKSPAFECTSCSKVIRTTYEANLHPLLDCLLCRKCYQSYGNGDFSSFDDGVDENGDDNYCRWCCDGGQLFGCMNIINGERCHYSFCEDCIKRNVPTDVVLRINELPHEEAKKIQWHCYVCDKSRLNDLRKEALIAMEALNKNEQKDKAEPSPSPAKKKRTSEQLPDPAQATNVSSTRTPTRSSIKTTAIPESTTTSAKTASTTSTKTPTSATTKTTAIPESTTTTSAKTPTIILTKNPVTTSSKDSDAIPTKHPAATSAKDSSNTSTKMPTNSSTKATSTTAPKVQKDYLDRPMPLSKKKALLSNSVRLTDLPMTEGPNKTKDPTSKDAHNVKDSKTNGQPQKPKDVAPASKVPSREVGRESSANKSSSTKVDESSSIKDMNNKPTDSSSAKKDSSSKTHNVSTNRDSNKPVDHPSKSSTIEILETNRKDSSKSMQAHSRKEVVEIPKKPAIKEVPLNKTELQARLDVYRRTADACVEEIGGGIQTVVEMMMSKDIGDKSRKKIITMKIANCRKPIEEFESILADLMRLNQSQ